MYQWTWVRKHTSLPNYFVKSGYGPLNNYVTCSGFWSTHHFLKTRRFQVKLRNASREPCHPRARFSGSRHHVAAFCVYCAPGEYCAQITIYIYCSGHGSHSGLKAERISNHPVTIRPRQNRTNQGQINIAFGTRSREPPGPCPCLSLDRLSLPASVSRAAEAAASSS